MKLLVRWVLAVQFFVVSPVVAALVPVVGSHDPRDSAAAPARIYEADSRGWYWVYEGIAQAQSFKACGQKLEGLHLRVARLSTLPSAPLDVEIRGHDLKIVYAHGQIAPRQAASKFAWAEVVFDYLAPLQEGKTYVLLLHSRSTDHSSPWVINAHFRDTYPDGRHLGYADDLFFAISFASGASLQVGPSFALPGPQPLGFGKLRGGPCADKKPTLSFGGRVCPNIARNDPFGPIPQGCRITVKTQSRPTP